MKQQVTIRLNETGQKALARMQERYDTNKAAPMVEKALLMHLWYVDKVAELEKKVAEQQSVISYLEASR